MEAMNVIYKQARIFGAEQISRDIGWFIDNRFSLTHAIAEYKFIHCLGIEDKAREQDLITQIKVKADMLNLPQSKIIDMVQLQFKASKIIQCQLFSQWIENPDSAPRSTGGIVDIEKIRSLISSSDSALLNYLANIMVMKDDALHYMLDFHFEHPFITAATNKEIKLSFYEIINHRYKSAL
ncbi:chorismate mutase [Aeromonas sp. JL9]|uniref:chorismate mutase n=1 Tax=Aeromonas sp. JL9 TaxID=2950549 RepID=UPI00210A3F36|nr:chorismate mutase [Aeromonas sp. JL9]MCQ4111581.1 chorismate mutase [Aeromonas sp. JL9]